MKVIQELHQYEDGLRPPSPSSAHTWEDGTWVLTEENAAELLRQEAERLCTKVDAAADSVRRTLAGDPLRALEYQQAALEAQAFKDQGYPKKPFHWPFRRGLSKGAQPGRRRIRFSPRPPSLKQTCWRFANCASRPRHRFVRTSPKARRILRLKPLMTCSQPSGRYLFTLESRLTERNKTWIIQKVFPASGW